MSKVFSHTSVHTQIEGLNRRAILSELSFSRMVFKKYNLGASLPINHVRRGSPDCPVISAMVSHSRVSALYTGP